ncbi:MAG: alkaline phosphatase [Calditerrivibrio sp.]|nr:alkaline phosphatase [Calditerrivibrio sp.]MCA1980200.1 alkaline phosphatase [Calditerrivibrio sp.]
MKRRDFLKGALASYLTLMAASEEVFAKTASLSGGNAKGVVFIAADGWPMGVAKGTMEFVERRFKEVSHISNLLRDKETRIFLQDTSSLSSVVTDSAPASVAWGTGSKTVNRTLATLPDGRKLTTIIELAKAKGMSCGVVTTTRLTHATPAAWYSHNSNRDDEDNIAMDILNLKLDVAMGGGDRHFNAEKRKDGVDLYSKFSSAGYNILKSKSDLFATKVDDRPILGVFNSSHISYFVDRVNDQKLNENEPNLPEMTAVALEKLSRNSKGFVLQIEAGRIDHACHANDAYGAMMDCYEMDKTIAVVLEFIRKNPNVILILASDHGNSGFGINGTGPEYNDATEALFNYNNKASFEYMIKKMKNQDLKTVKDIFETYTMQKITDEEAESIYKKLVEKRTVISNDIWYEPDATMGEILRKSNYEAEKGEKLKKPATVRRGNVGFTSTNHTAEYQLALVYGVKSYKGKLPNLIQNTDLYQVMCDHLGLNYKNPVMTAYGSMKFARAISNEEWLKHLELHIS